MNKRELVIRALNFQEIPYVPWHFKFTLEAKEKLPDDAKTKEFVASLNNEHPSMSPVRFWRVMVTGLIAHFDDIMEGESRTPEKLYYDVMDKLREA